MGGVIYVLHNLHPGALRRAWVMVLASGSRILLRELCSPFIFQEVIMAKRGRPPKRPEDLHESAIYIRLTKDERDRLIDSARRQGMTVAELVRTVLYEYCVI